MSLEKIMQYSFPPQTYENWQQKAEESLKGKKLVTLSRNTYEDIELKPLYTKEDRAGKDVSQFPGSGDFRRGRNALGYMEESWKIAQRIDASNVEQFKERLASSIQKGQTAIAFTPSTSIVKELPQLVADFYNQVSFSVNGEEYQSEILTLLAGMPEAAQITGYIGKDPVSQYAKSGNDTADLNEEYARFYETIQMAAKAFPNLKTILTDTTVYHNSGASAVQELAIALATAVNHIEQLKQQGMNEEDVFANMVFQYSIGSNFFMEVAKLRAARVLWSKMIEAYGVPVELNEQTVISADTSWFTKTAYDPYVNLLRAGNEAFAAVLGGVQYLHVSPYNEPEGEATAFSERIARNTQLLLRDEARLGSIVDPAGGSWYIETLTDELVEKAWTLFVEIDEKGGIVEVLKNKWLQAEIEAVKEKRLKNVETRKQSLVGTNKYANLQDEPLQVSLSDKKEGNGLVQERLSEPFERLRKQAEKLTQENQAPVFGLICLGKLKNHKARADFMSGFLAPGGIDTVRSGEIVTAADAVSFVKETNLNFFVLCGSDAEYEQSGLQMVQALNEQFSNIKLYVAGMAPEGEQDAWTANGIRDFITIKSNCYQALTSFFDEMKVEKDHE